MKKMLKVWTPAPFWKGIKQTKRVVVTGLRRAFDACGFTIARKSDYYSPLPSEFALSRTVSRWNKPSRLSGVECDVNQQKQRFDDLLKRYAQEYLELSPYEQNAALGYGPGFPELDALTLYTMVRDLKPSRYFEVGSGLSTYYCSIAAEKNRRDGHPVQITCVEPFAFPALKAIPNIHIIPDQVQSIGVETFATLEAHDILFIDSSHVVKIDGDVPFLFLEVIPALKTGVIIHVHDIPFPYNTPFPADQWVLGKNLYSPYWPMYWNEAMLLQALLCNNRKLHILLSTALIRHHDEAFLQKRIPSYKTVKEEPNTFSSIWLQVVD